MKYYSQKRFWTCGAVALRMVFNSLGIHKSYNQMIKLLGSNKKIGTWNKSFPVAAEKYKLNYILKRDSSIADLKKAMREKYRIIVCYYVPSWTTSHYSVVKKITKDYIYFMDPWFGQDHKLKLTYFIKHWYNGYEKDKRWFIGIK